MYAYANQGTMRFTVGWQNQAATERAAALTEASWMSTVGAATMIAISDAVGAVRLDEQMLIWTASGALPGCLCGTLWWFFDRRHAQLERGIEQRSHNG